MVHVNPYSRTNTVRAPQAPKPIHTYVDGSIYFDSASEFDQLVQKYGLTRQSKDEDGNFVWKNPTTGLTVVTTANPYTGEGAEDTDLQGYLGNVGLTGPASDVNSVLAAIKSLHVDELPPIEPNTERLTEHQTGQPVKTISLTNDVLPRANSDEKRLERLQAIQQSVEDY